MKSGVYKITNIINGKFYVGSSINMTKRKYLHFSKLRRKIHDNSHLQSSFNKYGEENFIFSILATCPAIYCIKLEQWFLDNLNPQYNKHPLANSSLGTRHNERFKELARINNTGKKLSEESKQKLSQAKKGKKLTIEHKMKISQAGGIKIIDNKTGIIYDSIKECANKNGFSTTTMYNIINKIHNKKYKNLDFSYCVSTKENKRFDTQNE